MPRISVRRPVPPPATSSPFVTLADAAFYVVHGDWPDWAPTEIWHDIERPADVRSIEELRIALQQGKLDAYGYRGDPTRAPVLIMPDAWVERPLATGGGAMYEPFKVIRVKRGEVLRLWSAPGVQMGRPPEHDWPRVKVMWTEERAKGPLSRQKMSDVLRSRYRAEVHFKAPGDTTMKEMLRRWDV